MTACQSVMVCGHLRVPSPPAALPFESVCFAQPQISLLSQNNKLLDCDQELYKNFPLVISERWQQEVAETVYEAVNADTDKLEARKRAKNKQLGHEEGKTVPVSRSLPDAVRFQDPQDS